MEKDNRWTIWFKIRIALEALIGLFVIWIACTVFAVFLTMGIMYVVFGSCTIGHLEDYQKYIQIGYATVLAICFSVYLRRLYRKYQIKIDEKTN